jgi:hypothetical protein
MKTKLLQKLKEYKTLKDLKFYEMRVILNYKKNNLKLLNLMIMKILLNYIKLRKISDFLLSRQNSLFQKKEENFGGKNTSFYHIFSHFRDSNGGYSRLCHRPNY